MYETRNETNPSSGHRWREAGPNDLTFRLKEGSRIRAADAARRRRFPTSAVIVAELVTTTSTIAAGHAGTT